MRAHAFDVGDRTLAVTALAEIIAHQRAEPLPLRLAHLQMHAAVSDDLDVAVGQQQIDQHAVVVFGVPDAQLGEDFDGALAGGLPVAQRGDRQRGLDGEADLAAMGQFAGIDRALDGMQR